jgi:hypothetical protein
MTKTAIDINFIVDVLDGRVLSHIWPIKKLFYFVPVDFIARQMNQVDKLLMQMVLFILFLFLFGRFCFVVFGLLKQRFIVCIHSRRKYFWLGINANPKLLLAFSWSVLDVFWWPQAGSSCHLCIFFGETWWALWQTAYCDRVGILRVSCVSSPVLETKSECWAWQKAFCCWLVWLLKS